MPIESSCSYVSGKSNQSGIVYDSTLQIHRVNLTIPNAEMIKRPFARHMRDVVMITEYGKKIRHCTDYNRHHTDEFNILDCPIQGD